MKLLTISSAESMTSKDIYSMYGFRPHPTTPVTDEGAPKGAPRARRRDSQTKVVFEELSNVPGRIFRPISLDFLALQHTIDVSLAADRRKMDGGLSPRELYVKSNPNLLQQTDFTNPRNWYSSTTQKNILKSTNNKNARAVDLSSSNGVKLPRIDTQERNNGTKSADDRVSKQPLQFDRNVLRRGPSFDETTVRASRESSFSSGLAFPPALGKSVSWPRGHPKRQGRRTSNNSSPKTGGSQISLPPLNPEDGQPFVPHLPPHQPWVSSKRNKTAKYHSQLIKTRHKSQRTAQESLHAEPKLDEKINRWFKDMSVQSNEGTDPAGLEKQVSKLPPHHVYKVRSEDKWLTERDKIVVPYPKEQVQYPSVFQELRIKKPEKQDNAEINRHDYKMKQKSELQLKVIDRKTKKQTEDKNTPCVTQEIQLGIEFPAFTEQTNDGKTANDKNGSRKRVKTIKKKVNTKADRNTGIKFLLAKVPEDDDTDSLTDDDEDIYEVMNSENKETVQNFPNEMATNAEQNLITHLLPEAKTSVVNLVLSSERPPDRTPHHIELSLKKIEESKIQSLENSANGNQPTEGETVDDPRDIITDGKTEGQSVQSTNEVTAIHEKRSGGVIPWDKKQSDVDQNGNAPVAITTFDAHKLLGNPGDLSAANSKDFSMVDNSVMGQEGTHAQPKYDKSALSKYNVLRPFRDGSKPNIVLHRNIKSPSKPACNEWTHPPVYRFDLNNYENTPQEGEAAKQHA